MILQTSTLRDVERPIFIQKSANKPSVLALERFQKARKFTHKLSQLNLEINPRFLKKLTIMVDAFYEDSY